MAFNHLKTKTHKKNDPPTKKEIYMKRNPKVAKLFLLLCLPLFVAFSRADQIYNPGTSGGGGGGEIITTVTASVSPYTATATTSINYINADTSAAFGPITVTLPDAAAAINKVFHIKKLGLAGNVIVNPAGANKIDGQATMTISGQWSSMHIVSDGNNWFIN